MNLAKLVRFVEETEKFKSYMLIETNGITINAKSLLGMCLLTTGLAKRTVILRASGTDANIALEQLKKLFSDNFG
jgi:phosphocarrier protein